MAKKPAISFAESALLDLESIGDYYAEQQAPQVGDRLHGEIVAAVEALAAFPDRGRVVPEFGQPHLPELIQPPFRVVYLQGRDRIRVVRVWRSERLLQLP